MPETTMHAPGSEQEKSFDFAKLGTPELAESMDRAAKIAAAETQVAEAAQRVEAAQLDARRAEQVLAMAKGEAPSGESFDFGLLEHMQVLDTKPEASAATPQEKRGIGRGALRRLVGRH